MCDLVYLVVATTLPAETVASVARAYNLRGEPADERAVSKVLADERLYGTFKQCSCGTELGARVIDTSPPWTERDVRAHERAGWSASKIARWKAQREAARVAHAPAIATTPSREAREMAACLQALLAAGATHAGFVVYQAGNKVVRAPARAAADLDAATVQDVPFDTVQVFTRWTVAG